MALSEMPELKKIADTKPTIVLGRDVMTFVVYSDAGEPMGGHQVELAKLIDDKDNHGLLMWAMVYQLHGINGRLAIAQQAQPQQYNLDELLDKAMGAAKRFAETQAGGR